jgi:hypothetical protein
MLVVDLLVINPASIFKPPWPHEKSHFCLLVSLVSVCEGVSISHSFYTIPPQIFIDLAQHV